MRNYNTNQRRMLNDYLSRHADECISTADIISAMAEIGISGSAVYRNLAALENEGKLRRISRAGEHRAYYQYIGGDLCRGHIHLSCIKCGKTTHVSSNVGAALADRLKTEDDFTLDSGETVIYGFCKNCRQKND